MKEIWKDVSGYEGLYQVSNLGRIKSSERHGNFNKNHILIGGKDTKGYRVVSLTKNGKGLTKKVHRLVAQAFILNPKNLPQINHIDGNKQNNTIKNLEWCDNAYNYKHSVQNKLRINSIKELKKLAKKREKKVYQYNSEHNLIAEYDSITKAQRKTKVSHISDCCLGKIKRAGGYFWSFQKC